LQVCDVIAAARVGPPKHPTAGLAVHFKHQVAARVNDHGLAANGQAGRLACRVADGQDGVARQEQGAERIAGLVQPDLRSTVLIPGTHGNQAIVLKRARRAI